MKRIAVLYIIAISLAFFLPTRSHALEAKRAGLNMTPAVFTEELPYLYDLGIGVIRINLHWQVVEPRPGEFDWSLTDRIVDSARDKGAEVLFTIRSISSWGTRSKTRATGIYQSGSAPSDMQQWTKFLRGLASRYRGRAVYYEIENEVNSKAFWNGTQEEYIELLKTSYRAIKREDPQAVVLPSAMACGIVRNYAVDLSPERATQYHDDWLRSILATGAFDVVNVHNYYFPSDIVANGLTFKSYLEHIRMLMKETGMGERPIWVTETGYVSRPTKAGNRIDDGSPEKQAWWLAEAYRQAFESGVERVFWLLLRDRSELYFGSMGLTDDRRKPRPAMRELQHLVKSLGLNETSTRSGSAPGRRP